MKSKKDVVVQDRDEHWGIRLVASLKEKKISLRKAAVIAGVPPSTVDSWSAGRSPSDLKAVKRLSDHLEISFTWLLTGEEDRPVDLEQLFDGNSPVFVPASPPETPVPHVVHMSESTDDGESDEK